MARTAADRVANGQAPVNNAYKETGGLRWGETLYRGMNASWPFAKLHASRDQIRIEVSLFWVWRRTFKFSRADIRALRRTSGTMSVGLRVEHERFDYPPFIVFWTFQYPTLKARLGELGYEVLDR